MRRTGSPRAIALVVGMCAALAAATSEAADEFELYQTVDRQVVGVEDTFRLNVVLKNAPADGELRLPALDEFEVLSKSPVNETSVSVTGAGTRIERITRWVLVLRARRTGSLIIPPATLTTGGKLHRTDPLEITVKPGRLADPGAQAGRARPPDPFKDFFGDDFPGFGGRDPFRNAFPDVQIPTSDSDLFLRTYVDKQSVFVGEQVTLSVYVFSRVDLSSVDTVNMPRFEGFWSEDIESPTQLAGEQRTINGVPYRTYLLKRKALFPTRAGKVQIDPVQADITTGYLFAGHRVHRKGNAVQLEVKPLPAGAPQGFSATNVGRWRLTTEAVPTRVRLGEPVTVRVSVEGRGNLKNVRTPKLELPESFRVYDPTTTDKVATRQNQLGGRRVQEYLVMPSQTGSFTLPAMRLPFFNPEIGAYEIAQSEPIGLLVEPGTGPIQGPGPRGPIAAAPEEGAPRNMLTATGMRPLRHRADFRQGGPGLWRRPWFAPAVLSPFGLWAALGVFGLVRRHLTAEDPGAKDRQQAAFARKRLKLAQKLKDSGTTADFYAEVERALISFLEAKLRVPVAGLTHEALVAKMQEAGVPELERGRVISVLQASELGRYAPGMGEAGARERMLDDAFAAMKHWETR
jgi:hypothetical protein